MAPERDALIALRDKVAALRAPPCGMAHESIPAAPDGGPVRSARSPSGYARAGICSEAMRANHLACSHTMARHVLRDALERLSGAEAQTLLAELHELEQAISILDHRRYDAESRRADAMLAGGRDATKAAEREIADLVAEHRGYGGRAIHIRDAALRRLDEAITERTSPA